MFWNGRSLGITEMLQAYREGPIVVFFALTTQLADVWFIFLLGGTLYVAGEEMPRLGIDRRRGLFVLALALTYVALIGVLKNIFVLPRPPGAAEPPEIAWIPSVIEPIFHSTATAYGPGFPSGHALGSTMVWGGLALVLNWGSYRTRLSIAGAVVALVSFSRLALGVHYLVDIVVGAAIGVVVLWVLYRLADNGVDPGRVLLVAVVIGVVGLLLGVTFDSVTAVGGAVGGWLVWRGIADSTPAHPTNRQEVVTGFLVLGVTAAVFGVIYALEPPLVVTFVGAATAAGGAVGAPLLGERIV